jgi:tetratricopeptide (TPR) repeat protein
MKKQQASINNRSRERKVVRLRMDAGFFFERAIRSLDRHHYEKALKYFRLAVEKEPGNPVNQCNLAGILSEMGHYEESNEVLQTVLQDVDPELYECYFYMANNAANMEEYEQAEEYLIRYLEEEPDGEFAREAEEMLQMLGWELGRKPRRPGFSPRHGWLKKHEEARVLMEQGQFLQAIQLLKELTEEHPDFIAAMNNLALAYYYTGDISSAYDMIQKVLDKEPDNIHAWCNLAVLYQHQGELAARDRLVKRLKQWIPLHVEHLYKLGTTMGVLGEHEAAYQCFCRLLRLEPNPEPSLYHYVAAAASNTGRLNQAKKYWRLAQEADPQSEVPVFYLNQLDQWAHRSGKARPTISYHYQLPFEEQLLQLTSNNKLLPQQIKENPLMRSSFFWALHHGDRETKLQVLQVFQWIFDDEVEKTLREFICKEEEEDELKRAALFVLERMGAPKPYKAHLGGQEVTFHAETTEEVPAWLKTWQRVLECCLQSMQGQYEDTQLNDAKVVWAEFLNDKHPDLPQVRKVESWAAALEYVVAKMHGLSITQATVARKHDVAVSTVGRHVRELESVIKK